jgi:hypothetical protein
MKKAIIITLIICIALNIPVIAGIGGKKAAYYGGTMKEKFLPEAKDPVEGTLNTGDEKELKFQCKWKKTDKVYSIPYDQFIDIEYGQKAGRRVGTAVATTVLLGPIGLISLFSKKRKHFVTIGYKDADGKEQVAAFELGKDIVRTTLPILEARSGKKIQYQDEEAKKSGKGNS